MCRLAAYLGPSIPLEKFLIQPEHSLYSQAWQPKEMTEARLNADGFGFVWWNNDCVESYINTRPIWGDPNLPSLARNLISHAWLACVRSATPGQDIHEGNTQPFISDDGWVFAHNGMLGDFHNNAREAFHHHLPIKAFTRMRGVSDSEYWFALLRHYADQNSDMLDTMHSACVALPEILSKGQRALLNTVLSNGEDLFICRHALRDQCPTLYYRLNGDDDSAICASEPFDDHDSWQAIPEHTLIHLRAGKMIRSRSLTDIPS